MTRNKRTLVYVAFALILGSALALAFVLARDPAPAGGSAAKAAVSQSGGSVLGDTLGSASIASADPAKQEPMLDKFTSKDPFIPLTVASTSGGSTSGGGTTTTTKFAAHIKVNGTSYTVVNGDKVPSSSPAFSISSVTSSDVTFGVIDGTLKNGDSAVTVNLGESVKATLDNGKSYTLAVVSIGSKTSGSNGSGGTLSTSGHTISVLSVTSSNGVALATIEVDGKTYPDKKVGVVITTSWGQIKILAIDVNGQTVTVMHGDQTVVLHAGQVVIK